MSVREAEISCFCRDRPRAAERPREACLNNIRLCLDCRDVPLWQLPHPFCSDFQVRLALGCYTLPFPCTRETDWPLLGEPPSPLSPPLVCGARSNPLRLDFGVKTGGLVCLLMLSPCRSALFLSESVLPSRIEAPLFLDLSFYFSFSGLVDFRLLNCFPGPTELPFPSFPLGVRIYLLPTAFHGRDAPLVLLLEVLTRWRRPVPLRYDLWRV